MGYSPVVMDHVIYERRDLSGIGWTVRLVSQCDYAGCRSNNPGISLLRNGYVWECWHMKRLFGRNRSSTECVILALTKIQEYELKWMQEKVEVETLKDFATQIVQDRLLEPGELV